MFCPPSGVEAGMLSPLQHRSLLPCSTSWNLGSTHVCLVLTVLQSCSSIWCLWALHCQSCLGYLFQSFQVCILQFHGFVTLLLFQGQFHHVRLTKQGNSTCIHMAEVLILLKELAVEPKSHAVSEKALSSSLLSKLGYYKIVCGSSI